MSHFQKGITTGYVWLTGDIQASMKIFNIFFLRLNLHQDLIPKASIQTCCLFI